MSDELSREYDVRRSKFKLLQLKGSDTKISAEAFASLAAIDPTRAEEYYRVALDAQERTIPKEPKRIAVLLNDLALALQEKHDYAGAETLFRKALLIQENEIGHDSPAAAGTVSNLGSLLEAAGPAC